MELIRGEYDANNAKVVAGFALPFLTAPKILLGQSLRAGKIVSHVRAYNSVAKLTRTHYERLALYGVVIEEARRATRTLGRVERTEGNLSPAMLEQKERLEARLEAYYYGEASYSSVVASRIMPPARERVAANPTPAPPQEPVPKRSKDEYLAERAQRAEEKKRKTPLRRHAPLSAPVREEGQQTIVRLGDSLQQAYERGRGSVAGFPLKSLIELTVSKLSAQPEGTVLRRTTPGGKNIMNAMVRRHDIDPDSALYKTQPISSLRALYMREGNALVVLEILTHEQYDTLMKAR
jgi:hypothetical protein